MQPQSTEARSNLRTMVRGAYDLQKMRIQAGNRIVANWKAKLGQAPGTPESDLGGDEQETLKVLRNHFKRITDGMVSIPTPKKFKGDSVIATYTELALIAEYMELESTETKHFGRMKYILEDFPIYTHFLKDVRGVGPAMAGVIISEIDIHAARYVSSLWRYAGLDVAQDGRGRSRQADHLIDVEYTDKNGDTKTKKSITFNPFLKTKLTGVLVPGFIKQGRNPYSEIYYTAKNREQNKADAAERTKMHIHNRAIRYAAKQFLADLYNAWRPLEGLEIMRPYSEEKLGRDPHGGAKATPLPVPPPQPPAAPSPL